MELCRCCYYKTSIESSKNVLMESYNDIKFVDVLNKIANITISENDKFTKSICHHCYEILLFICDFITLVKRTDNKLHKNTNDEHMDTDSIVDTNQSEINETKNDVEGIVSEVDVVGDFYDAQNDRSDNEQDASEDIIVIDNEGDADDHDDNSRINNTGSDDLHKNSNQSGEIEKTNNCPICNKFFSNPCNLKRHMPVHNRSFKCTICNKICLGADTFKEHTKMHHESMLKCVKCGNTFRRKSYLKKHLKSIHKLTLCNICCQTFEFNQIEAHLSKHTEQRAYSCKVCQYSTDCKSSFKKHIKRHVKNGVFACHICGKRFPRLYSLDRHLESSVHKSSTK